MKRRYFLHYEITRTCMQAGVRRPGEPGRDVFDVLADKMRTNPEVVRMLAQIGPGENELDKVLVGIGKEYDE